MTAEPGTTLPHRRLRAVALLFWIVPAIMGALGFHLVPSRLNPDLSSGAIVLSQLAMWGMWALWTVVVWWVGDRFPFARGTIARAVAVHAALGVIVITLQILVQSRLSVAFGLAEPRGLESTFVIGLRTSGDYMVVLFSAIVVAQAAFRWYERWQAESIIAARLGADLANAHLRALQAQLNPHFLFNALNSVVTLIGRDPQAAQHVVVSLADLLRATLRAGDAQEVTLAAELDVTRRYLDIERVRFADRLTVEWPEGEIPSAVVPAFALQPLVENALVHGIGHSKAGGRVTIAADREGDTLVLRVVDTGVGLSPDRVSTGAGTGLRNLRARIARLYGDAASLDVAPAPGGGTVALLRLPYRPAPVDDGRATPTRNVERSVVPATR